MPDPERASEKASDGCGGIAGATVFLSVGAVNAALAMTIETCTQGSADSLQGGFITLIFYMAGVACLAISRPSRLMFVALAPAMAVAAWHTFFAMRFATGYFFEGMSACFAMKGGFTPEEAGEWMDGREPLLIALWVSLSLLFWGGVVASFLRPLSLGTTIKFQADPLPRVRPIADIVMRAVPCLTKREVGNGSS